MPIVREHGAAVVALTIDETGQARTARAQGRGRRAADRDADRTSGACATSDIIVDCLTFTLGTGQEESRRDGLDDDRGDPRAQARHPDVQTMLGSVEHLVRAEARPRARC